MSNRDERRVRQEFKKIRRAVEDIARIAPARTDREPTVTKAPTAFGTLVSELREIVALRISAVHGERFTTPISWDEMGEHWQNMYLKMADAAIDEIRERFVHPMKEDTE